MLTKMSKARKIEFINPLKQDVEITEAQLGTYCDKVLVKISKLYEEMDTRNNLESLKETFFHGQDDSRSQYVLWARIRQG